MTTKTKPTAVEASDAIKEEQLDISSLKEYEFNAKEHKEDSDDFKALVSSISRHGISSPINVDKNMVIITGHGRVMACKKLGLPTIRGRIRTDLTDNQVKELRISDNRSVSNEYDTALQRLEFKQLDVSETDLTALNINMAEFEKMTLDFTVMDSAAFTEDLDKDVDDQAKESEQDIKKTDLKLVSVVNGLGFKVVTVDATRKIAKFIATLQEQFDLEDPAAAFVKFIEEVEAR